MRKLAWLLLALACPSFGALITGGYIDFPSGHFEFKSDTFDVFGALNVDGYSSPNSTEPYAAGNGPEGIDPAPYVPGTLGAAYGTVNGIYYSGFLMNVLQNSYPMPFYPPLPTSLIYLSGPTIYGDNPVETAPFTISGNLNLFTDHCIECGISLSGGGTTTWSWSKGQIYGLPQIVFTFDANAPVVVPEPSTWLMMALAGVVAILRLSRRSTKLRGSWSY